MAVKALHVRFGGRLSEREMVGAEPHNGVFAVHALNQDFQRPFQVGKRNPFVHNQPFNLVEQRGMGGIHRVRTVNPPGGNNADGRLLLFHHAHLHGRRLRAQQDLVVDVERVLCVTRRMVFRHIQRFKVIVVILHFRPADNVEAHSYEDFLDFVQLAAQRVLVPDLVAFPRQGNVNFFLFQPMGGFRFADFRRAGSQLVFNTRTHFVGQPAGFGPFFSGKTAHLF